MKCKRKVRSIDQKPLYPGLLLVLHASLSAFIVYSCMYGVRKPYTVSSFSGLYQFGISYKVVLVSAQVFGYMLSKFIGIRFIAQVQSSVRPRYIILLILIGWLSLFFFAVAPFQYKFLFLFINGLPLGMIWGLVFSYLEGRKWTDLMGSLLATSFIVASGFAKTVGGFILQYTNIDQWWMPFSAASLFLPPLFLFTYFLHKVPPPTLADIQTRSLRLPMDKAACLRFIKNYGLLMIAPVCTYVLLTIVRDFSEDFAAELWKETNQSSNYLIFSNISFVVGLSVMVIVGLLFLVKNNARAFYFIHLIILAGFLTCLLGTFLYQERLLSVVNWMVLSTAGFYLGYVTSNSIYYERMLATFKINGNVGFLMYIADSFGYLGTVVVLLIKELAHYKPNWISFFSGTFYLVSIIGIILVILSYQGFRKRLVI